MMQKSIYRLLFALLFISLPAWAIELPDAPQPARLVNDFAKILDPSETEALEQKLVAYYDSTSTQIAIVIFETLDGYPIEDYAFKLGEKWGIGQKDKDNGLLMLVSFNEKKIFIATGYGMEGAIPDIEAKRIISDIIAPDFRKGNYYSAFDNATNEIIALAGGEYKSDASSRKKKPVVPIVFGTIFFLFIVAIILISKYASAKRYARLNNVPFWIAWAILNAAMNKGNRSSGGGFFGGGSSGWGGGGGSSFGGFGGGSFGGGGAGGSW